MRVALQETGILWKCEIGRNWNLVRVANRKESVRASQNRKYCDWQSRILTSVRASSAFPVVWDVSSSGNLIR